MEMRRSIWSKNRTVRRKCPRSSAWRNSRRRAATVEGMRVFLDDRHQYSIRAFTYQPKPRSVIAVLVKSLRSSSVGDGAVAPLPTLLIQHLMIITDENITFDNKEEKKEDLVDEQTLQLRKILKTPLEDLDLSVRAFNCLKANDITTVGQLLTKKEDELLSLRNFGRKSLDEIKERLVEKGFVEPDQMDSVFR